MATPPIVISGPLFKSDSGREVRRAIGKLVSAVAVVGKQQVQAQLTPGHGKLTGRYRRTVTRKKSGKLAAEVRSKNTMMSLWLEGGSNLLAKRKGSFPGYHIYENAYRRTDATAGEQARKIVAELVRALN